MRVAGGKGLFWSIRLAFVVGVCLLSQAANADEALFLEPGASSATDLPAHTQRSQSVRVNRRALQAPALSLNLFGEELRAVRDSVQRHKAGQLVWVGHLEGNPANTVIVTIRGNQVSGVIYRDAEVYRLGVGRDRGSRVFQLDMASLPPDDAEMPLDGGGLNLDAGPATPSDGVGQDLLVVYTQGACNYAGGCANLEADIVTAVTDLNTAYSASGVNITMNLVGMALTNYTGTDASATLTALRSTTDGNMDEVHGLRDDLGADIVSLIYDGAGCGIGYLPASATSAFNVTDVPCLVGNRTMAHEIGHNQGAHHDRVTAGAGTNSAYNYGFRRCSDGSVDDFGSPYFRTIMSYSCASASRIGRFSNPYANYSGVPTGVDPDVVPGKGAWNVQTLNNSASYVAGFRPTATSTPPAVPTGLTAGQAGPDAIDLAWIDNATDETSIVVQRSPDGGSWSTIATLPANTTTHNDDGLQPDTTYYYRVAAGNGAGNSDYSNVAFATTASLPASIDDVASADVAGTGTVSGTFVATHADDGVAQTITEQHAGGPKRRRKQSYVHGWTFDVFGGAGGVVVTVNAGVSGSEGARFHYSVDGGASWPLMFTIDAGDQTKTYTLPGGTSGTVRIEVRDATQSNGESVDSVSVDSIVITSHTDPGSPPAGPTMLSATAMSASQVSVDFMDNAGNEFGYEVMRATADPGSSCSGTVLDTLPAYPQTGPVNYQDTSAAPATTYWYWVRAFNGAGPSSCSTAASATTWTAPDIDLVANGYKVKGRQHADLTWSGIATAMVDIYRDGTVVATVNSSANPHTDNIGRKGGGSYDYQVCEAGSSNCSPIRTVVF